MAYFKPIVYLLLLLLPLVEGYRQAIKPRPTTTTSEVVKPWRRTIYSTQREIVTPIVIAGVTLSAKPPASSDPLEPWVSLDKLGNPKTIKPKIEKGRTVDGHPDYSTYFKTVHTTTFSPEELKAHNLETDELYTEEFFEEEDETYVSLNPIIRCTPNRYRNKGLAKDISSEPFCTPFENVEWKLHETYFVTWYTKFFEDPETEKVAERVRLHLFYVKENPHEKGFKKRSLRAAFFSSETVKNVDGLYPIKVDEEWFQEKQEKRVLLAIQPEYISDEAFDPWSNGILLKIIKGARVAKNTKEQLALQDAGISDDTWYYVALSTPTVVVIACVAMYFFLFLNKKHRDIRDVRLFAVNQRRRVLGSFKDFKKYKKINNRPYSELPTHSKKSSKQG
ncbi:LANO_0E13432g1_1 [Lachancea nothofagi CBS 11611]|uniref:LANO_0E13432g1_1 n=1 Tax=Lachancea nothofagi CBS 11611 TaxID=1266666 RepID=A0A1G4JYY5_9SACH|nr:LANO_0E13432g1_1 [Lachancea nothofagi CBS 11611]